MKQQTREIIGLVRRAGVLALNDKAAGKITEKGEFDYATEVDTGIQKQIREALEMLYPGEQFLGEEADAVALDLNQPAWILDPIDGTTNLIHRYPECAVSLAHMVNRQIVLGVVYNPFRDELFYAEKGGGAYRGDKPMKVSEIDTLHDAILSFGSSPYTKQYARGDFEILREMFEKCQDIRRAGAAALDMVYVALGIVESFYERKLNAWDYSAAMLIVTEAGGCVTTFNGAPVPVGCPSPCLATNGRVHEEMLAYTRRMKI